jgi:hypothetical protein
MAERLAASQGGLSSIELVNWLGTYVNSAAAGNSTDRSTLRDVYTHLHSGMAARTSLSGERTITTKIYLQATYFAHYNITVLIHLTQLYIGSKVPTAVGMMGFISISIQFLYLRACQQLAAYNRQALNIQIRTNSKTKTKYYKFYLLGYNALQSFQSQPLFRAKISPSLSC